MNEYYEILGLKPGASKEEVEQTYRDLLSVWNPDSFANDFPLQKKAEEKIKKLDEAYEKLILHLAKTYEQPYQNKSEKNIKLEEKDSYSVHDKKTKQRDAWPKEDISSKALTFAFLTFIGYLGFKFLSTSSRVTNCIIGAILGALGGAIGYAVVQGINRLNVPKKQKIMIAWVIGIIGFFVVIFITVSLEVTPTPGTTPVPVETEGKWVEVKPKDLPPELRPITPAPSIVTERKDCLSKGRAFMDKGSYHEAIDAYSKAIELGPKDVVASYAYSSRGLAYMFSQDFKHAIEDFSKAMEIKPQDLELLNFCYYYRGRNYLMLHNYEQAIRDFDRAIELNYRHSEETYFYRGWSYYMLHNYEQAIRDFDRAIELNYRLSGETYFCRGLSYYMLHNYEQAIRDFDRAIELNYRLSEAYFYRGLSFGVLANDKQAIVDISNAARLGNKDAQDHLSSRGIVWQRD